MNSFDPKDSAELAQITADLVKRSGGLKVEWFESAEKRKSKARALRLQWYAAWFGLFFIICFFYAIIIVHIDSNEGHLAFWTAAWALSMGGIGAVASIIFNLIGKETAATVRPNDVFEVVARILIGCIFGFVIGLPISANEIRTFLTKLGDAHPAGVLIFAPFVVGYSNTLAIGVIDKVIYAISITIGIQNPLKKSKA